MEPGKTEKKDQKLLWRIHHWAGLYTGIIIAVLSITGAAAMFISEIDLLIQKQYYSVSSSPSTALHLTKSIEQVERDYPDMSSLIIDLPETPGQAAGLNFFVKGKTKADLKRYYFFVDAGKDKILDSRDQQNSLANYLRQMHVRLYEGVWGRQLVGIGGIALLVMAVTGLLIYSDFMKKQPYPKIRKGKGLRILMADWHKILGMTALAFNLIIAITGAWLGLQPRIMTWSGMKAPNFYKPVEVGTPEEDRAVKVRWDDVMPAIKKEFPDLIPAGIIPSTDGSQTIDVSGNIEGQAYERNANTLILSKTTLKPLFKYDIRNNPFSHKFYFIQEALHFGNYGGLGLKIIYAILGLTSGFLSISGFVIYLHRTDKKEKRKLSPAKTTFIYSIAILMVLVILAIISMFIGYNTAATISGWIINGGLLLWLGYILWSYFSNKTKPVVA